MRALLCAALPVVSLGGAPVPHTSASNPVIIDTDIGSDIDDAFAVALALQSPELHILGFSTVSGNTDARARILDQILGVSDQQRVPVASGRPNDLGAPINRQRRFGERGSFAKANHPPAVGFILDQIRRSPGQVTLVTIGPLTNIAELIDTDLTTFLKIRRLVMMGGSVHAGYGFSWDETNGPTSEFNIRADIDAARKVFESGVPIFMIPTDATADLKLDEVRRDALLTEGTPLTNSLGLLYLMWGLPTPILHDAMAVGFAVDPQLCPVVPLHIVVNKEGFTRSTPGQPNAQVCLRSDREVFFRFFMSRFPAPSAPK